MKVKPIVVSQVLYPAGKVFLKAVGKCRGNVFANRRFQAFLQFYDHVLSYRFWISNRFVERPLVEWSTYKEGLDAYSMHDENCDDVRQLLTNGPRWKAAWLAGSYGVHLEDDPKLSYSVSPVAGGLRFRADDLTERWIYLVAREELPTIYALDFDYVPHTEFAEQLQLDFAAESLAKRHRFNVEFCKDAFYDIVENGRFVNRGRFSYTLMGRKCRIPLHVPMHVRLEVVENVFTLLLNGEVVFCVRDGSYRPRKDRSILLFWNGNTAVHQVIDFELLNFRILLPARHPEGAW